jgi:hypothetical protein
MKFNPGKKYHGNGIFAQYSFFLKKHRSSEGFHSSADFFSSAGRNDSERRWIMFTYTISCSQLEALVLFFFLLDPLCGFLFLHGFCRLFLGCLLTVLTFAHVLSPYLFIH